MIADSPFTDNITDIDLESSDTEFRNQLLNTEYSDERTYGFEVISNEPSHLSANLITSTPERFQRYDPDRGEMVTEDIVQAQRTPFRIDFERRLLEVFANKEKNGEVVNRLGQVTQSLITHDIPLDLVRLHSSIRDQNISATIDSLRINNFSLRENTNGNCYLNTYDEGTAQDLIDEYQSDITYLGTEFEIKQEAVTVGFYRSGSIRLYSKTEMDEELIELIKDLIQESGWGE